MVRFKMVKNGFHFLVFFLAVTLPAQEIDLRVTGNIPPISGAAMQHITTAGNIAYVCAASTVTNLFLAIEIAADGQPRLLGQLRVTGSPTQAAIAGSHAYVCAQSVGVHIVDISDSENLTLVRTYNTPGNALRATAANSHLFIADGTALLILGLANPANPVPVGQLPGLRNNTWDVAILNDLAYLTSGSGYLQIVDISNPAAPTLRQELNLGGSPDDIEISGGIAFITGVGSSGNFRAYSLADPLQPQQIGSLPITASVSIGLAASRAYISSRNAGFNAADITTPGAMRLLGRIVERQAPPSQTGVGVTANGLLCYTDSRYGFTVVQDTPANPSSTFKLAKSNLASGLLGPQTLLAQDTFNLYTASLASPSSPVLVSTNPLSTSPKQYFLSGDRLVLVGSQVSVYRLHPDSSTELLAQTPSPFAGTVGPPVVNSDVILFPGITAGLLLTRLTPAHELQIIGQFQTNNLQLTTAAGEGSLAVTTSPTAPRPIYILDISDPASPRVFHEFSLGGFAAPYLQDGLLYLADSNKRVFIYDLQNPGSPSLLGAFSTRDRFPALSIQDRIVYAAEFGSGFEIWNLRDPSAPARIGGNSSIHAARLLPSNAQLYSVGPDGIFVFQNPAQEKPLKLTATKEPGMITLHFEIPTGRQALLQRTTDFITWDPLQTFPGSLTPQELSLFATREFEFFRLKIE